MRKYQKTQCKLIPDAEQLRIARIFDPLNKRHLDINQIEDKHKHELSQMLTFSQTECEPDKHMNSEQLYNKTSKNKKDNTDYGSNQNEEISKINEGENGTFLELDDNYDHSIEQQEYNEKYFDKVLTLNEIRNCAQMYEQNVFSRERLSDMTKSDHYAKALIDYIQDDKLP